MKKDDLNLILGVLIESKNEFEDLLKSHKNDRDKIYYNSQISATKSSIKIIKAQKAKNTRRSTSQETLLNRINGAIACHLFDAHIERLFKDLQKYFINEFK